MKSSCVAWPGVRTASKKACKKVFASALFLFLAGRSADGHDEMQAKKRQKRSLL